MMLITVQIPDPDGPGLNVQIGVRNTADVTDDGYTRYEWGSPDGSVVAGEVYHEYERGAFPLAAAVVQAYGQVRDTILDLSPETLHALWGEPDL